MSRIGFITIQKNRSGIPASIFCIILKHSTLKFKFLRAFISLSDPLIIFGRKSLEFLHCIFSHKKFFHVFVFHITDNVVCHLRTHRKVGKIKRITLRIPSKNAVDFSRTNAECICIFRNICRNVSRKISQLLSIVKLCLQICVVAVLNGCSGRKRQEKKKVYCAECSLKNLGGRKRFSFFPMKITDAIHTGF